MKLIKKILVKHYERKAIELDRRILREQDDWALVDLLTSQRSWYERKIKTLKERA